MKGINTITSTCNTCGKHVHGNEQENEQISDTTQCLITIVHWYCSTCQTSGQQLHTIPDGALTVDTGEAI